MRYSSTPNLAQKFQVFVKFRELEAVTQVPNHNRKVLSPELTWKRQKQSVQGKEAAAQSAELNRGKGESSNLFTAELVNVKNSHFISIKIAHSKILWFHYKLVLRLNFD